PGMMDTILNIGLNDKTVIGLADRTKNLRFAYDSYRRLIQMFGTTALGIEKGKFEEIFDAQKRLAGVKNDTDLSSIDLRVTIDRFKDLVLHETGKEFPQDVHVQVAMARDSVFKSWRNQKAIDFRKLFKISENIGTAVTVQ